MPTQVKKNHYISNNYHSFERFVLYYEQITAVLRYIDSGALLEIGVGNKTVSDYLIKFEVKVKTLDFDEQLKPDYSGDVRDLKLKDNSFDMVTAFEVLEHIPYKDFEKALSEMCRVAKKYVIISLPVYGYSLNLFCRLFNRSSFKENKFCHGLVMPFRWKNFDLNKEGFGEHYWEIGTKITPFKKVKESINNSGLRIVERYHSRLEATTMLLVLEKI